MATYASERNCYIENQIYRNPWKSWRYVGSRKGKTGRSLFQVRGCKHVEVVAEIVAGSVGIQP